MEDLNTEILELNTEEDFKKVVQLLIPIKEFVEEKHKNKMYDDWNEYEHNLHWLSESKKNFLYNNKLYVYILKDKNKIIGINFVSLGENIIKKFKKDNNLEKESENNNKAGILSAFHILKKYRNKGIGFKWLNQEVFRDLKTKGIEIIYIKSSHNKALNLYDKLGERVGNYIGISDNHLYQRLGYIFKIKI